MVLWKLSATQPAPLVATIGTCHMIAAFIRYFDYSRRAHATIDHIALSFCPLVVFCIIRLLARDALMFCQATLPANHCATGVTRFWSLLDRCIALGFRTPLQILVQLDLNVLQKKLILSVQLLRSKLLNIGVLEFKSALVLDARDLPHLACLNLSSQMLHRAVNAEDMSAPKPPKFSQRIKLPTT